MRLVFENFLGTRWCRFPCATIFIPGSLSKAKPDLVWNTLKTLNSNHFVLTWQYGLLLSSNQFLLIQLLFLKIWGIPDRKKVQKPNSVKFNFQGWIVKYFMTSIYKLNHCSIAAFYIKLDLVGQERVFTYHLQIV